MLLRKRPFPWASGLALVYPIAVAAYMCGQTRAILPVVLGYGLVNLAYVLLAAGILAGTFRVFGIYRRWQVFALAVVAFLSGTALSNLDF
jgi:hypothetical protein